MSEVFGHLNVAGERLELTRDNVTIYTHLGRYALFNHVFVTTPEDQGVYIWAHHPNFTELAELAEANQCVIHANLPQVSEFDENAYVAHAMSDVGDTLPEDWTDGTSER